MSKVIFISTGEVSGDRYAARLVQELKRQAPDTVFVGVGGEQLKKAGVTIITDVSHMSTIGILEPLKYVFKWIIAYFKIVRSLKKYKPDLFIPVDNQGFHMLLLKKVQKLGIKSAYYIAPQEWQWGSKKGGEKVIKLVDKVLAIFPQEAEFYKTLGGDVTFVGHPCMDNIVDNHIDEHDLRKQCGLSDDQKICAICPGSRPQEIKHLLTTFINVAKQINQKYPTIIPVVSIASVRYKAMIEKAVKLSQCPAIKCYEGHSLHVLQHAHCALVASGTVSLECALLKVPSVVAYKFHPFTYWIATTFFKKQLSKITYMALPNMILNDTLFSECLQEKVNETHLLQEIHYIMNEKNRIIIREKCEQLYQLLNSKNTLKKVVNEVLLLAHRTNDQKTNL